MVPRERSKLFAARETKGRFTRGLLAAFAGAVLLSGCSWLGLDDSSDDTDAKYQYRLTQLVLAFTISAPK